MGEFLLTQRSQRSDGSESANWGVGPRGCGTRFRVLTRGLVNGEWEEVAIERLDKDALATQGDLCKRLVLPKPVRISPTG